jgi:hypothetical protein
MAGRLWMWLESHVGRLALRVKREVKSVDGKHLHDAAYCSDEQEIEVAETDNITIMEMRAFHEMMHVCFDGHSTDKLAKVFHTEDVDEQERREEDVVSFLETQFYDLLKRNGLLRFPKPPKLK